jgi:hypothetical protein
MTHHLHTLLDLCSTSLRTVAESDPSLEPTAPQIPCMLKKTLNMHHLKRILKFFQPGPERTLNVTSIAHQAPLQQEQYVKASKQTV